MWHPVLYSSRTEKLSEGTAANLMHLQPNTRQRFSQSSSLRRMGLAATSHLSGSCSSPRQGDMLLLKFFQVLLPGIRLCVLYIKYEACKDFTAPRSNLPCICLCFDALNLYFILFVFVCLFPLPFVGCSRIYSH